MRLVWNAVGERFYETGVDRGVLYVAGSPGVAWGGLISVAESPSGGEARAYYQDGIKYANLSSSEEFEAALAAFAAPPEFGPCEGVRSVQNGLFVTQQPRKSFGLSYRTMIGNDSAGKSHAYKIHLVYNALVEPAERNNNTLSDNVTPTQLSWKVTTTPPALTGYKPTAHFVVDSRTAGAPQLAELEDVIYGSVAANARLPQPAELVSILAP